MFAKYFFRASFFAGISSSHILLLIISSTENHLMRIDFYVRHFLFYVFLVFTPPPPVTRPLYPSISTCSRQSSLTAMQLHATGLYCLFDLKCRIPWLLPTSNCDSDRTHFPKLSQVAMLIFISKGLGKLALPKKHDVNQRNHCLKFEEAQIQ